jgi:ketosteroid isomerase-like protein
LHHAECTPPAELVRRQFEAGNRGDIDAVMSSFAVDAVLEGRALGDIVEGQAAIRAFVEGWFGMYEELEFKLEEVHDLGNGVVLAVVLQEARPAGIAVTFSRERDGSTSGWGAYRAPHRFRHRRGACRRRTPRRVERGDVTGFAGVLECDA